MGCDIHVYVEYANGDQWRPFGGNINPGRSYEVFGHLAGVRSEVVPVAALRGMPDDAAYQALEDNRLFVDEDGEDDATTRANAERYVASGASQWVGDGKMWVTHPDWHSHTWLTADEWEAALGRCATWPAPVAYYGVLGAMRAMEARGCRVRAVFWFDN